MKIIGRGQSAIVVGEKLQPQTRREILVIASAGTAGRKRGRISLTFGRFAMGGIFTTKLNLKN